MKTNKNTRALRKPFMQQLYKGNRLNLAISSISTVWMSLVSIMLSFVIQQIIDSVSGTANSLSFATVAWMTAALIVSCIIFGVLDSIFTPKFTSKAMSQYKTYVFDRIMKKSISSFSEESTSTYISALSNDATAIETNYLMCIWEFVEYYVWFFGAFALMLWYSPLLTLIAIGVSLLPIIASVLTGGKMANVEKQVSRQNEGFIGVLKDALSGFTVIKSFKAEMEVSGIFGKSTTDTEKQKCKKNRLQSIIKYIGMLAGVTAQLAVFIVGAALAGKVDSITPGVIMAFVNLMGLVVQPIGAIPALWAKRRSALALIDKLADSLSINIRDEGETLPPELNEAIELKSVCFEYEENKPVLKNISYSFEAGKSYAIVGGSGSGKSTLLSLLMAGQTDYSGEILYDGKELKGIAGQSLYDIVSLVQQNVFVFDSTIRENITMFRNYPDNEVDNAIKLSGLSQLIATKGEDYDCGENGSGLSGGERQRISIARALLRRTPVLLVDEATAALDKETAYLVSDSILNISGLTRIVITHDLNETLLRRYDSVLVLKSGVAIESGSFDELMNKKGYFYSLYTISQ